MRRTTQPASRRALASVALSVLAGMSCVHAARAANPPATGTAASTPAAVAAANEAAAKHVKRTACIKEARARKLVGADRNAYIKNCVASP